MKIILRHLQLALCTSGLLTLGLCFARAQEPTQTAYPIDLATALRLAGARNQDIQIARKQLGEARANRTSAIEQFFPWIEPGVGYHRRDGVAQAVPSGIISKAHFYSYYPGVTITARLEFGDAIFNVLAKQQLVKASDQAVEAQRLDTMLSVAVSYFDLAKANALVDVANESVSISQKYQKEQHAAVDEGVAFKGDELRIRTQTEHYEITLQEALAQQRIASVNLAQILYLDPRVELVPVDSGLTPVTVFPDNASTNSLIEQAMIMRPELKQNQAVVAARRAEKNGAIYGPLIPSIDGKVFLGSLGGGPDEGPIRSGSERDYTVSIGWRIGPGGLFDIGRIGATKARLASAQLADSKLRDQIASEVITSLVRVTTAAAKMQLAKRNLHTASETLRLTEERKEYGVGIALENIQAQQALTQARSDYITIVADYNKAQYALMKAVGDVPDWAALDKKARSSGTSQHSNR